MRFFFFILQKTINEQTVMMEFAFRFNPHNVLGIRSFADTLDCGSLKDAAEKYIQQYFHEVSLSEEFLALGLPEIIDLVKRDELYVSSEEQVSILFCFEKLC